MTQEEVTDDPPPADLDWGGLLQRQFEVEHMLRWTLSDDASIDQTEGAILGLLRFMKQLKQVRVSMYVSYVDW
jgi:hypothetical protein